MRCAVHIWRVRRALAVVWLALVLASAVVALTAASPASAHTDLVSATPSSGSTVEAAPSGVELDFSWSVQARLAQVVVRDAEGRDHVIGPVASFGSRVEARVQGLRAGRYTVAYRVVAADGHPVVGRYTFDVAAGAVTAPRARTVASGAPAPSGSGGGLPWVPLLGVVTVVSVAALRVVRGGRRLTP